MAQQPAMLQHGGMRGFEHLEHHNPHGAGGGGAVMDEFLDHMFAIPPASCFDMGPRGGVAGWEYSSSNGSSNAAAAAAATVAGHQASAAAMAGGQGPQGDNNGNMGKLFTMSLMPPGLLSGVLGGNQGLSNNKKGNESIEFGGLESQMQQDSSAREGRNELIEGGGGEESTRRVRIPGGGSGGDGGNGGAGGQMGGMAAAAGHGTSLTRSASLGSSGSEDSGPQQQQQQQQQRNGGGKGGDQSGTGAPVAPTWYNGGGVSQMPMGLTPAKAENVLVLGEIDSHDTQSLGKRFREDDDALLHEGRPRTTGVMPTGAVQGPGYGNGGVMSQSQPLQSMGARPRVRARRGQATDPHSIAERLRRERIAERMKALQELVPNSNKTDKASMLDEIIEYVRFLQLQVKVLSMSRMGGAGALAPLVADLPPEGGNSFSASAISSTTGVGGSSQDGLALTERQVTRLMEDDMGSAMQYLQSKGLCLMPISLASAISTTSKSQGTLPSTGAGQNQLTAAAGTNGKGPAGSSAGAANKEGSLESGRAGDTKSPKNEGSFEEDT